MSEPEKVVVDPKATTTELPPGEVPPVIVGPPISREEHNDALALMRSMMEEVRQLRLDMVTLKSQSPSAPPNAHQSASTGSGGNTS